jgi:hypothetical protein
MIYTSAKQRQKRQLTKQWLRIQSYTNTLADALSLRVKMLSLLAWGIRAIVVIVGKGEGFRLLLI